jgi:hypothetical protein
LFNRVSGKEKEKNKQQNFVRVQYTFTCPVVVPIRLLHPLVLLFHLSEKSKSIAKSHFSSFQFSSFVSFFFYFLKKRKTFSLLSSLEFVHLGMACRGTLVESNKRTAWVVLQHVCPFSFGLVSRPSFSFFVCVCVLYAFGCACLCAFLVERKERTEIYSKERRTDTQENKTKKDSERKIPKVPGRALDISLRILLTHL